MINQMFVMDALEDSEFIGNVPQGFMVVGLERNLFHGHDVSGPTVDGGVDLPEMTLTCQSCCFKA